MHPAFREAVESLEPKYQRLIAAASTEIPLKGVYLFRERGKPLYVGRSNNIPRRRKDHCRLSSGTNKAAFARLIACKELELQRDYGKGRDKFKSHPGFSDAFQRAKTRVAAMEFCAVEEPDPIRQALLEVYCAVASGAKYNDFDVH